tara:strand:+ start:113 stop:535 length:423 start_codon:yes stop_codon:yes gene_type:complete
LKNIDLLIELNKSILEEKRRELGLFLNEETSLENQIVFLDNDLIKEQNFSKLNIESIFYYDNYARSVSLKKRDLEQKLSQIRQIIFKARELVNEAYLELRKFEITKENADKKEKIEISRQEQVRLDDISINMFLRNANGH